MAGSEASRTALKASFKAQTLASADVLAWSLRKGEDGVYQTESDQLYVPDYDNLRRECFELVHSDALSGHFGIARTIVKARRHFFWPSLSKGIKDWVTSCDSCQRVKALRQKPYGKLQPLQIPGRRWESIPMDLIANLPVTPQGHEHLGPVLHFSWQNNWASVGPLNERHSQSINFAS